MLQSQDRILLMFYGQLVVAIDVVVFNCGMVADRVLTGFYESSGRITPLLDMGYAVDNEKKLSSALSIT